ncbi:unnamed protein product, partial [Polarella glacialis]
ACDGKYSTLATFRSDLEFCSRSFVHRCRLVFRDSSGVEHEAFAPLPLDLQSCLGALQPRDSASATALSLWASGAADWSSSIGALRKEA